MTNEDYTYASLFENNLTMVEIHTGRFQDPNYFKETGGKKLHPGNDFVSQPVGAAPPPPHPRAALKGGVFAPAWD